MGDAGVGTSETRSQRGAPKKLLAHAVARWGELPPAKKNASSSPAAAIAAAAKKAATMGPAAPRSMADRRTAPTEPLLEENLLAWDVAVAMEDQVEFVPMGGPFAFKLASLDFLFRVMVPKRREREVLEKFFLLKPYALNWVSGGGDGRHDKNADDPAARRRGR